MSVKDYETKNTEQLNLKIPLRLKEDVEKYCKEFGYTNSQEFIREAMREKIFDSKKVRPEYLAKLDEMEKNPDFLSVEESKKSLENLRKRANLE